MRSESQPNQVDSKRTSAGLPLFHLYGDPPNDQAFDFVHIERISSRSSVNDWLIQAHRHFNRHFAATILHYEDLKQISMKRPSGLLQRHAQFSFRQTLRMASSSMRTLQTDL